MFLSLFDDNPKVKRVFCPPKECYDKAANADDKYGKPLPSFSWLIDGKVCALNFPIGMNPGLAKAIGVMMKLDILLHKVAFDYVTLFGPDRRSPVPRRDTCSNSSWRCQ